MLPKRGRSSNKSTLSRSTPECSPCNNFQIDLGGDFGTCKNCGRAQSEHKSLKSKASWKKNLPPKRVADDRAADSKSSGPCNAYVVDLFAREFGVCKKCGFPQASHRNSLKRPGQLKGQALRVKESVRKKTSEIEKITSKEPCSDYKVDLMSRTGYGVCIRCGHSQAKHKVKAVNANLTEAESKCPGETKESGPANGTESEGPHGRVLPKDESCSTACECSLM